MTGKTLCKNLRRLAMIRVSSVDMVVQRDLSDSVRCNSACSMFTPGLATAPILQLDACNPICRTVTLINFCEYQRSLLIKRTRWLVAEKMKNAAQGG
jgi:hypothetical protein